ncbi:MAG TPA: AI-2E family transporter, partial [Candidatus Limnocylindrales bacterium]|nr:AI-2E family transporter [Candidatus Limnocylindrales bacterium]
MTTERRVRRPRVEPAAATTQPTAPEANDGRGVNRPFVALVIAALILLWLARAVLGPFIVAAVTAYAFSPVVSAGQRRLGWPRIAVVGVGYVIALILIGLLLWLLAGRIVAEITLLASSGSNSLATTLRNLLGTDAIGVAGQRITVADIASQIQERVVGLMSSPGDALHIAGVIGETALQAILALIVTFYFLIDGPDFRDHVVSVLPRERRGRTVDVLSRIHETLGKWLRGQILLVFAVAAVTYVVLGPILHLPYALAIAVLTGLLEVIPLVGPLAATAIAGTDAFTRGGPTLALIVVVFYFVLRQIEDQVVMPVVIGRAVHLHPVVTILAVLVGLSTYGVLGGLLGVPVAAALNVVYRELYRPDGDAAEGRERPKETS